MERKPPRVIYPRFGSNSGSNIGGTSKLMKEKDEHESNIRKLLLRGPNRTVSERFIVSGPRLRLKPANKCNI